jgi:hypothetical protein
VSFPFPSFPNAIKRELRSDRLKEPRKKERRIRLCNKSKFYSLDIGGYGENKLDWREREKLWRIY